jgi:phosphate transport system substrate-binding protein
VPQYEWLNGAGASCPNLNNADVRGFRTPPGIKVTPRQLAVARISQLLAQIVDFGATDSPMTDADLAKSTNGPIVHIPGTLGGVAVSYNVTLPSGSPPLKLKGDTIANIFLGKITKWNDAAIAADNSGVTLPDQAITVVHRSDGSGTTGIFTHYRSGEAQIGPARPAPRSTGQRVWVKGNDGVNQVKNTAETIGYNELGYVLQNGISYAAVRTKTAALRRSLG